MNMKKTFSLILACLLVACTEPKGYKDCTTFGWEAFSEQAIPLKGKIMNFDVEVKKPVDICSFDSLLVLNNMNTDTLLDVYNLNGNRYICSNVAYGNGPEEFLNISSMQENDSLLVLFDPMKSKSCLYRTSDVARPGFTPLKVVSFEERCNQTLRLPTGRYLGFSYNEEGKPFAQFDEAGTFLGYRGDYPDFGEELSVYEKIESFVGDMVQLDDTHIAVTHKRTDLIEIYDSDARLLKRLQGPDGFFPAIKQQAVGEQIVFKESANESRDAYFHPCVHNGQLWVLYSGKYFGKSETPIYLNNRILVFDAQGVPQKQYVLDIPIFAFTINESRNTIYGITEHPEMEIVEFKIP